MTDFLHYNLYNDGNIGICNLLSSVENAIIIAALTGKKIKFYGKECIDKHCAEPGHPNLKIYDLYNIHFPYEIVDNNLIDPNIPAIPFSTFESCVFYFKEPPSKDFLNGRPVTFDISSLSNYKNVRTKNNKTLGFYSYLFYFNDPFKKNIDTAIKNAIKPKQKYIDLCNSVLDVNNILNFNCIHIRRGSFCYNKNNDDYPCYSADVWLNKLEKNFCKEKTLLIATDEIDKNYFKPILSTFKNVIFINDLLKNKNLCNVEKGVTTLLIAGKSENFIGTFESTFTAYIQRYRIYNGFKESYRFLFSKDTKNELNEDCTFVYNNTGKYMWNKINSITKCHSINSFHWKRDWIEQG